MATTPNKIAPPKPAPRTGSPMKNRIYRCDDETFAAAEARAKADGIKLSEVIRHYLREYGAGR